MPDVDIVSAILGQDGSVARRLGPLYEYRPQQIEMAHAVSDAIHNSHHLMVEAGTGVGKSFAYLLPIIEYVVKNKKRAVISTHTISLQEQLIEKDIPLLRAVYPDEFSAVLVKGRSNYLCRRRLDQALQRRDSLFETPRQVESLLAVEQWSHETTDGSLADLPNLPDAGVWDRVCAEHGNCLGKNCRHYKECFWQDAKRRMFSGNILVVNHALFFSDLALRISGVNYLPKYDVAILDEAHTVEDVAADHFGLNISEYRLRYQLRTLYDPKRGKGVLSTHGARVNDAIDAITEIHERMDDFFERCSEWQQQKGRENGRIHEAAIVENNLTPLLSRLSTRIKAILPGIENIEEISELTAMAEKVELLGYELDAIVSQKMPDAVYWIERGGRFRRNVSLHAAPINVAEGLRMHLFAKLPSVILCSATLCTSSPSPGTPGEGKGGGPNSEGPDPAFSYMLTRLGAESAQTLALGSPFDYAKQATLYIESDLPDPSESAKFAPAASAKILEYLQKTRGGAFVLFTSYSALKDAAQRLKSDLEDLGYPMLIQGEAETRKVLLDRFRTTPNAVLFGTSSFWQGIDVRGEALRNVIIVKLPFSVPDEPVIEARLEAITRAGGNPFMEYSVPQAIIRLKQGFGRLIRSKTDTGIVVILDSRIKTKRYGKRFLQALPPCTVVVRDRTETGEA
jgi:ATP-dependent DNA helicase DinG